MTNQYINTSNKHSYNNKKNKKYGKNFQDPIRDQFDTIVEFLH